MSAAWDRIQEYLKSSDPDAWRFALAEAVREYETLLKVTGLDEKARASAKSRNAPPLGDSVAQLTRELYGAFIVSRTWMSGKMLVPKGLISYDAQKRMVIDERVVSYFLGALAYRNVLVHGATSRNAPGPDQRLCEIAVSTIRDASSPMVLLEKQMRIEISPIPDVDHTSQKETGVVLYGERLEHEKQVPLDQEKASNKQLADTRQIPNEAAAVEEKPSDRRDEDTIPPYLMALLLLEETSSRTDRSNRASTPAQQAATAQILSPAHSIVEETREETSGFNGPPVRDAFVEKKTIKRQESIIVSVVAIACLGVGVIALVANGVNPNDRNATQISSQEPNARPSNGKPALAVGDENNLRARVEAPEECRRIVAIAQMAPHHANCAELLHRSEWGCTIPSYLVEAAHSERLERRQAAIVGLCSLLSARSRIEH